MDLSRVTHSVASPVHLTHGNNTALTSYYCASINTALLWYLSKTTSNHGCLVRSPPLVLRLTRAYPWWLPAFGMMSRESAVTRFTVHNAMQDSSNLHCASTKILEATLRIEAHQLSLIFAKRVNLRKKSNHKSSQNENAQPGV